MNREARPDPFAGQPNWEWRLPAPIVPVPAVNHHDLRGRRVIVGLPGLGWRTDLRGDDPVVQGSRTYVPVIPEHEWYRAEAEQVEVFAALVPIERVWVEVIEASPLASGSGRRSDSAACVASLDAPPRREPRAVVEVGAVLGRRIVGVVDGVERRDLRAVTDPYSSSDEEICVRAAGELDWYRWAWSGQFPKTLEVPVHLLWVE